MSGGVRKAKGILIGLVVTLLAVYFFIGAIRGLYLAADAKQDCIAENGWSAVIFSCDEGPNMKNWAGYVLLWPLTFDEEDESQGEKTFTSVGVVN